MHRMYHDCGQAYEVGDHPDGRPGLVGSPVQATGHDPEPRTYTAGRSCPRCLRRITGLMSRELFENVQRHETRPKPEPAADAGRLF